MTPEKSPSPARSLLLPGLALAPVYLFEGHTLTMNAFEPLFWTARASGANQ